MLKRILGRKVRDKPEKYGIRKCRRKRTYMGGKGRRMWESTLEKGPGAGMLMRILREEVGDKTIGKYRE